MTERDYNIWFNVRRIADDLWSIEDMGFEISYLITGKDKALLIDTGFGMGDISAVVDEITSLPLIVVNTHAHPDHAGGDDRFPEVYLHEKDLRLIDVIFSRHKREEVREHGRMFMAKKSINIDDISDFDIDRWMNARPNDIIPVSHGAEFDLGDRTIEVFSLPGHTPGCIVLLDRKTKRIFAGDSIIEKHPVWLHLEESSPLHVYHDALVSLSAEMKNFNEIYSAHMKEAIHPSIIHDLRNASAEILTGKAKGRYFKTFAGEGFFHRYNRGAIIYRENGI